MSDSILNKTKKALMIPEDYDVFDETIILHINTVFSDLNQMGVGPLEGYFIEDAVATWDAFLNDDLRLNNIKTYMFLRVRALFDPPTTSYSIQAMERQIEQFEYRILRQREDTHWVDPLPPVPIDPELILDGGSA
jgi:hypothetical protein